MLICFLKQELTPISPSAPFRSFGIPPPPPPPLPTSPGHVLMPTPPQGVIVIDLIPFNLLILHT